MENTETVVIGLVLKLLFRGSRHQSPEQSIHALTSATL